MGRHCVIDPRAFPPLEKWIMSVSRWKIMACSLGLSLGGLAICAGQSNDRSNAPTPPPAPTPQMTEPPPSALPTIPKPMLPATAPDTMPPIPIPIPTPAKEAELEIVPVQATAPATPPVSVPTVKPPVVEPSPMPRELSIPPAPPLPMVGPLPSPISDDLRSEPMTPPMPPAVRTPEVAPPEPPAVRSAPPVAPVDPPVRNVTPPAPLNPPAVRDPLPPADVPLPPRERSPRLVPPMVAPPPAVDPRVPPIPPPVIDSPPLPQAVVMSRLKLLMRLGDGKPRFEIRTSDSAELLFKVYGERVEMQSPPEGAKASPIAGVTAVGKVRFTGPMVEGTCDQLIVLSGTGEVLMKGNVHVKTRRGKTWSEMTTEKMIYQIGASSLVAPNANPIQTTGYQNFR
jgi:hypothetical protein